MVLSAIQTPMGSRKRGQDNEPEVDAVNAHVQMDLDTGTIDPGAS